MKRIAQGAAKNAPAVGLNALLAAQAEAAKSSTKVAQLDIYPKPDHNFYNIVRSRFWMNRMNRDFMFNVQDSSPRTVVSQITKAYTDLRQHKKLAGITVKNRNLEIRSRGHQRVYDKKVEVRKENRAKMAFFCRYVLATKKVTLMGSGL
jgi:hypothetical protein